jgi:hypothetical protein
MPTWRGRWAASLAEVVSAGGKSTGSESLSSWALSPCETWGQQREDGLTRVNQGGNVSVSGYLAVRHLLHSCVDGMEEGICFV